jgi:hypothetical protein
MPIWGWFILAYVCSWVLLALGNRYCLSPGDRICRSDVWGSECREEKMFVVTLALLFGPLGLLVAIITLVIAALLYVISRVFLPRG